MAFSDLEFTGGSGGSTPTVVEKTYFSVLSKTSISVSGDNDNPSYFEDIILIKAGGFEISDALTGAVKNISGRTIELMKGTVSFNPDNVGGGSPEFYLFSERSEDGITWTLNADSLRPIEISNNSETFRTVVSTVVDLPNNYHLRFRMFTDTGSVNFDPTAANVLGGQTITGPSVDWNLNEVSETS